MMDDDPSKKESKGKRIFKKAVRRNSKSTSNSGGSAEEAGVSRSKSQEVSLSPTDYKGKKSVEIHESQNKMIMEASPPVAVENNALLKKLKTSVNDDKEKEPRNLKRKLEEEAGTSSGAGGASGAGGGGAGGGGSASASASPSAGASDTDGDDKDPSKDKKKKNRCAVCRKKVGLTGFECRCGGLFCAVHRYSDKHECSFDYRELGAQEIRRNNPVVVSQKIHKI